MDGLERRLQRSLHAPDAVLSIRRMDIVHNEVQQAIRPQAVALAVFGALAALAMLVLVGQGLAVLKTLGLRRRQLRAIVAWQASIILVIAGLAGVPLGVTAGHWAWASFASTVGFVPVTVVPVPTLFLSLLTLLTAGNLLAAVPAAIAARTPPAAALRAE